MTNYMVAVSACFVSGAVWAGLTVELVRAFEMVRPVLGG